jgi:branched-chain amino acid transport system substrate-binding protein
MSSDREDVDHRSGSVKVSRRKFLGVSTAAAVGGIVAGVVVGAVGGYLAGQSAAPAKTVTATETKTVTTTLAPGAPTTITQTVTQPVTTTVTVRPVPPKSEIVIGSVLGLTGSLAYFGFETKWAYERAVKAVNERGGIYLREYGTKLPVKLIIYDDKSDPTARVSLVEKLITVDKVDAILGSVGTTFALAAAPVIEKYKVPCVSSGVASVKLHEQGYKYAAFTNFFLSYDQFLVFFKAWETLPEAERPKTVAIWEEATEHGKENADYMEKYSKEYGYKILLREKYPPGSDFTDLIAKTKALNPDVVLGLPTGTDAINMIRQAKELNFCPKMWAMSYGTTMASFQQELKEDAEYVCGAYSYHTSLPFSVNAQIVWEYRKETGIEPTLLGCWYASAEILFDAIERAGSLDKDAIREALLKTDLMTTMGRVAFEPDGRLKDSWKLTYLLQWQHGKLEVVWPPEVATSKLWYPTPPWDRRK